jgi:microcompartment protein CcmL/EutN
MFTQIELKVADAVELYKGLEAVKKHKGARFAILVARNAKELEYALKKYEDIAKPSEEFLMVSGEAHRLAEAEDEEGIKALEEKHADLIEQRKSQIAALEKAMEEVVEFNIQKIKEDQLPEDITPEEVVPLLPILV